MDFGLQKHKKETVQFFRLLEAFEDKTYIFNVCGFCTWFPL